MMIFSLAKHDLILQEKVVVVSIYLNLLSLINQSR